jgi:hypothetical protein
LSASTAGGAHTVRFNGERWDYTPEESADPDVTITTTRRDWAALLAAAHAGTTTAPDAFELAGSAAATRELRALLRIS